jgi:hypothetical protein
MAKNALDFDAGEKAAIEYVANLFEKAKFAVQDQLDLGTRRMPDLLVSRIDLGVNRNYAIEIALVKSADSLPRKMEQLHDWVASMKRQDQYDEYWLVSNLSMPEKPGRLRRYTNRNVRHFTIKELERLLAKQQPKRPRTAKSKTRIGKGVEANKDQILVQIASLMLQVDAKLGGLRDERPNSLEATATRDTHISEYENLRSQLEDIRNSVTEYISGKESEKQVVEAVNTFKETVAEWWDKSRNKVLDSASSSAVFVGSAGLLHLMNADSGIALAIAGTLIGGETVVKAIKALPRRLF